MHLCPTQTANNLSLKGKKTQNLKRWDSMGFDWKLHNMKTVLCIKV